MVDVIYTFCYYSIYLNINNFVKLMDVADEVDEVVMKKKMKKKVN